MADSERMRQILKRNRSFSLVLGGVVAAVLSIAAFLALDVASGGETYTETTPRGAQTLNNGEAGTEAAAEQLDVTGTTPATGDQTDRSPDPGVATESAEVAGAAATPLGTGSIDAFESIRNRQDKFWRYADVPSDQLDLNALTEQAPKFDNGWSPEGQFRVACEYSHFGYDDPIIFPRQPGASHLHMFFGNTELNAFTTLDTLVDSGGGTCSGYELNRSGYWTPALLDGRGNVIVPDQIIIYYKTKYPDQVSPLPQGMQMLAGNFDAESFETRPTLHWSCGPSGTSYNKTNRIPDCGGDVINAAIQFPNCWDGVNLSSDDFVSHLTFVDEELPCPGSHPTRLPQITILIYFPGSDSVDGWHLSSDVIDGFNGPPGGTLHADWWGGWNDDAMDLWINGCMRASRNCSFGQTGGPRQLAHLNGVDAYRGDNILPLP